jgi:hypothetical protein
VVEEPLKEVDVVAMIVPVVVDVDYGGLVTTASCSIWSSWLTLAMACLSPPILIPMMIEMMAMVGWIPVAESLLEANFIIFDFIEI